MYKVWSIADIKIIINEISEKWNYPCDIKIEISLGSSPTDNSKPYSSYKLDLNTLLSVIKSYVDREIRSLSNSVDAISTSLSNEANSKFVQISGETR